MKLATWNVNSLKVRLGQLTDWLAQAKPDAVCLQETKLVDGKFPTAELEAIGYRACFSGQKTYNGVAIVSPHPLGEVSTGIPGFADEQKRVIAATLGNLRIVCLYAPNGQAIGSEKYDYKLRWYAALRDWLADELARHPRLAVLGDLNVAPEDRDVHDPKAWQGQVLVSEAERAAFRALIGLGLKDGFRLFEQAGQIILVVGLPDDGLSAQRGPAHRPHPALARTGRKLQLVRHRQGAAQARAPLGPHPGHCRAGLEEPEFRVPPPAAQRDEQLRRIGQALRLCLSRPQARALVGPLGVDQLQQVGLSGLVALALQRRAPCARRPGAAAARRPVRRRGRAPEGCRRPAAGPAAPSARRWRAKRGRRRPPHGAARAGCRRGRSVRRCLRRGSRRCSRCETASPRRAPAARETPTG